MAKFQVSGLITDTMIAASYKASGSHLIFTLSDGSKTKILNRRILRMVPVGKSVHVHYLRATANMILEGDVKNKYKLEDGTVMVELETERNGLMHIPSLLCKELDDAA